MEAQLLHSMPPIWSVFIIRALSILLVKKQMFHWDQFLDQELFIYNFSRKVLEELRVCNKKATVLI